MPAEALAAGAVEPKENPPPAVLAAGGVPNEKPVLPVVVVGAPKLKLMLVGGFEQKFTNLMNYFLSRAMFDNLYCFSTNFMHYFKLF